MKKLSLLVVLAVPASLGAMAKVEVSPAEASRNSASVPTQEPYDTGIAEVQQAVLAGTLTTKLVFEHIQRPFYLNVSQYIAMLRGIKAKTFLAAAAVLKEGAQPSVAQIENALAGIKLFDILHTFAAQSCIVREEMDYSDREKSLETMLLFGHLLVLRDAKK